MDMWAVGCVFAEMLRRMPLFNVIMTTIQIQIKLNNNFAPLFFALLSVESENNEVNLYFVAGEYGY